jgi:uncharacterized protein (TIGR00106 family)
MMIRGLSYQRGIFFMGKSHVACAYHEKGRLKSWIKPYDTNTMFIMLKQIISSMPWWFKLVVLTWVLAVSVPKIPFTDFPQWSGLPFYTLIYLIFGTHFIFPRSLRKYHGAEHKVFSDRGVKRRGRLYRIKKAAITNRYCSTNIVVIYFLSVILLTFCLIVIGFSLFDGVMYASYAALLFIPFGQRLMKIKSFRFLRMFILKISYWLQVKVTTEEPEHKHLICAIQSYRMLAKEEFPEHLLTRRAVKKKEEKHMAIVDVTVIPIGTESPSVSQYVAEIQQVLASYDGKITFELTPMSTLIEGELPVLFEVIQEIHEVPFKHGLKRVATNIRIDDRRDKESTLQSKRKSVEARLVQKVEE